MSQDEYTPPKVWTFDAENGGKFASINKPTAGAQFDRDLPTGEHPFQLYSLATPNGVKVTMMFEELLAAGHDAEYDAWLIKIGDSDQFGSGFVGVNPNSKIPALMDYSGDTPVRVFESGSILLHLAEKFGAFLPTSGPARTETLNWLFWQMGSAPYLGGGFGHFYAYAPFKMQYPIDRFTMETKRQMDVLDQRLAESKFLGGDDYSIADMAVWPWYGVLTSGKLYSGDGFNAAEFIEAHKYTNVVRWYEEILARPAVQRGRKVNRMAGPLEDQLHERHSASDFDTHTQDKLQAAE
ncbi:MAG: glutathione-dependent disulfide-bond oxidoreductase [Pseudomonadota bacterium]